MTWWNDFSIRPWTVKVLKCTECVTCPPSESWNADKVRVRACICVHLRSDCHSPTVKSKNDQRKTNLHYLTSLAARGCPVLVFFLVFKTNAGTSDAGYCDCRHVCDDEETHHEDHDECDHVIEDHDDRSSASGNEDCLVMFSVFHCTTSLYTGCSYGVVASSLVGLHDLVLVSVVTPFVRRSDVNPFPLAIMSNSSMSECVYPCSCMRIRYWSSSR